MVTYSVWLALADKELSYSKRNEENHKCEVCWLAKTIMISSLETIAAIFIPRLCCAEQKKHDEREQGSFKAEF